MKAVMFRKKRKMKQRISLLKTKNSAYCTLKERKVLENKLDTPNNHTRKSLISDDCLSVL
ncbi:MAG: hypothetical protein CME70_10600 [Halobacteriovorax sp.]|nr:hypothetical protein [Halobacteriovorax sp.]